MDRTDFDLQPARQPFGAERGAAYEALPKWRRNAYRPSCLDLVTLLRKEMAEHPELLKEFEVKITEKQLVRAAAAASAEFLAVAGGGGAAPAAVEPAPPPPPAERSAMPPH
jgi:hypothetical protein